MNIPSTLDYRGREEPDATGAEAVSWFGYIGIGIALAAMLLGIVGMVVAAVYLVNWLRG